MRILVISDTHVADTKKNLPQIILKEAKEASLCLHAGDLIIYDVFEKLNSLTKTVAVRGNMDIGETRKKLAEKEIIEIENIRIGLIHGQGAPSSLISFVEEKFRKEIKNLNIIVFGHSHHPLIEKRGKILYFNPGSPTDKFFAPYNSYGILEIEKGEIKPKIVKI